MTDLSCDVKSTYTPGKLTFPAFMFPSTLDRAEREEAAARIVSFSQQLDKWVGVTWKQLATMMKNELEAPEGKRPFSIMPVHGPQGVVNGIHELVDDEFIRHEKIGDDDVFYPTSKLATAIQGFAVA